MLSSFLTMAKITHQTVTDMARKWTLIDLTLTTILLVTYLLTITVQDCGN